MECIHEYWVRHMTQTRTQPGVNPALLQFWDISLNVYQFNMSVLYITPINNLMLNHTTTDFINQIYLWLCIIVFPNINFYGNWALMYLIGILHRVRDTASQTSRGGSVGGSGPTERRLTGRIPYPMQYSFYPVHQFLSFNAYLRHVLVKNGEKTVSETS